MIDRASEEIARKGLVRLLHVLVKGPARVERVPEDATRVILVQPSGRRTFARGLLDLCERRGLMSIEGERCRPQPEARALLKRLMAGEEFAFAAQHGSLAIEQRAHAGTTQPVLVNRDSSILATLSRLKDRDGGCYFPPDAIAAGERLAQDFHFAGLQPRITASLEPRLSAPVKGSRGSGPALSDAACDARERVSRAARALGPELSGVVLDICCFGKGLEIVERERQWPPRSAKLMLRTALTALSRHYG